MSVTYDTLDITDWVQRGQSLRQEINQAVKDTQRLIIRPYPHILLMRQDQYRDLQFDFDMMYQSDTYFYNSGENVMEVVVKE